MTPAERARRRRILSWIPAGIALVAIVVVCIVTANLVGGGLGRHVAVLPGVTHFTAKGQKNVRATGTARFDLRHLPLPAAAIQLEPDGDEEFGPFGQAYAELTFLTTGDGQTTIYVGSFHVISAGADLTEITTDTKSPDFSSMHTDLYQIGPAVGITKPQLGAFMNAIPVPGKSGSVFDIRVGTANALGAPTTVSAICRGAKGCDVHTVTRLPKE